MSPHQIRQAAGLAFRRRQRAHAPAATIPARVPHYRCAIGPRPPAVQCPPPPMLEPSIEERLCAAAHRILTDGAWHSREAQAWALRYLAQCAPGRELTAFVRTALRHAPVPAREILQGLRQC